MFGIQSFVIKIIAVVLGIIVGGIVLICVFTMVGCAEKPDIVSDEGVLKKTVVDDKKKQFALAARSETDNSTTDKSQDNSINVDITGPDVPANQTIIEATVPELPKPPELPTIIVEQIDPRKAAEIAIKVVDVKAKERENILKAQIDANIKQIELNAKQREESMLAELVSVKNSKAEEMAKIVEARGIEKERVIRAEAAAKEKEIRAREEKWRLMVWVVGIGAAIVAALALCIRSPLDRKKKHD